MKTEIRIIVGAMIAIFVGALNIQGQGTPFTYQGRLIDGPGAASGSYDLRFGLYDDANAGVRQGSAVTNSATVISNGLFTVLLDFGANTFSGAGRWLEVAVRTNGVGDFTLLTPRQPIVPTPYAHYSLNAGSATVATTAGTAASVPAANIMGRIPFDALPPNLVTNGAAGVNLTGAFSGDGAGVTNVNLMGISDNGAVSWSTNFFLLSSSPAVGASPNSVASGDVNRDGKMDLITANFSANTLTVLTNNRAGGFAISTTVAVGPNPACVVAVDVNRDGWVDLVSANNTYSFVSNTAVYTLSVLTNNRVGGFVLSSSPVVGGMPEAVIAADVDKDGLIDLISANYYDATLSVLTNNRNGGFALSSSPVVGYQPYCVVAADVNRDGKIDLISANEGQSTLTVLTNNGKGIFELSATLPVGTGPEWVTAADVNGDAWVDLISANYYADTLTVLTNDHAGGFATASSPSAGGVCSFVMAADLNGDGRPDLVSGNSSTLGVLENLGGGQFNLYASLAVGRGSASVVAMDVNADGRLDLISANAGSNTLSVLINQATPFLATFTGSGAGLSNQNATGISIGTLADARLSTNVALRAGGNVFTGNQGIGATLPVTPLHVKSVSNECEISIESGSVGGHRWSLQSSGPSSGSSFQILDRTMGQSRMTIDAGGSVSVTGRVGIGISAPQTPLHVVGAAGSQLRLQEGAQGNFWNLYTDGASAFSGVAGNLVLYSGEPWPNVPFGYFSKLNATYFASSDISLKKDINNLDGVLDRLLKLRPVSYRFKAAPDTSPATFGLIAQEVEPLFPEVVGESGGVKALGYTEFVPITIRAVQELSERLAQELKKRDAENAELKTRLENLEKRLNQGTK